MTSPDDQRAFTAAADDALCPSADALFAFSSGRLVEHDLDTIANHLSRCETCHQVLQALSGEEDALTGRLRRAAQPSPVVEEPGCLRMQRAAKALLRSREGSFHTETVRDADSTPEMPPVKTPGGLLAQAAAAPTWPAPPPVAIGRYPLRAKLGEGAFGTVYLAHDLDLDRQVAIKVPKLARGASARTIDSFLREARTAARLKHPGIVAIYDIGRGSDDSWYIVMEYVAGKSLRQILEVEKVPADRAAQILQQAAVAVHHAHKQGLVHRDLKPGNILVDDDGQVKIADFGLALHEDWQRSRAGERAGTRSYMSPEQIRGDVHRLDGRSDIWSLGVILYEMLTSRRPFAGTPEQTEDEILHRQPKPLRQIDDAIPPELEAICLKCLAKGADQRYSSARDLTDALADAGRHESKPGRLRSHPLRSVAAMVLLVACLAVPLLILSLTAQREQPYQVDAVAKSLVPLELMDAPPEVLFAGESPQSRWFYSPQRREIAMESPSVNILGLGETKSTWYKIRVFISKPAPGGTAGVFLGYQPLPPLNGKRRWKCQMIRINCINEGQFAVVRSSHELRENLVKSFSLDSRELASALVPVTLMDNAMLEVTVRMNRVSEVSWKGMVLPQLADTAIAGIDELPACTGRFGVVNSMGSCTQSGGQFLLLKELP